MKMEAARTSGTLVKFYQTIWHCRPEDSHLIHIFLLNISNKIPLISGFLKSTAKTREKQWSNFLVISVLREF
jgi:hypothetical protein